MKSKIETTKTVTLILNNEEAEWLKASVQNPIRETFDEESDDNKEMRQRFWLALTDHPKGSITKEDS